MDKKVFELTPKEISRIQDALSSAFEVYGKADSFVKKEGLRILNGWGRIIFVISNDGRRIGLELTERWERERKEDRRDKTIVS